MVCVLKLLFEFNRTAGYEIILWKGTRAHYRSFSSVICTFDETVKRAIKKIVMNC